MKKMFFLLVSIFICNGLFAQQNVSTIATNNESVVVYFENAKFYSSFCTANIVCEKATRVYLLYTIEYGSYDSPEVYFTVNNEDCFMSGNGKFEMYYDLPKGSTPVRIDFGNPGNANIYMSILWKGNVFPTNGIFGIK